MTGREKIIEILKQTSDIWKEEERHGYIVSVDLEKIADVLIAAGLRFTFTSDFASDTQKAYKEGYLKGKEESEAEIELAKAFHDEKCAEWELACYKLQKAEHRAEVAEQQAVVLSKWLAEKTRKDYPWQAWFDAAQKQAEKELVEEGKDD